MTPPGSKSAVGLAVAYENRHPFEQSDASDASWANLLRGAAGPASILAMAWTGLTVILSAFDVWSIHADGASKDFLEFAIGGCLVAASIGLLSSLARCVGPLRTPTPPATHKPPERSSPRG